MGKIIPILKPGKQALLPKSYRLIALLSPVAKLAEVLQNGELQDLLPNAEHQHGFRKGRSTITALNCIVHKIRTGLNHPQPCHRTVLAALDLSAAFDTVSHEVLIDDIYRSPLSHHTKRGLVSYLGGRSTFVEFRDERSGYRKVKQGVPQGGVLSPALFNTYMSSMPLPPQNTTMEVVSYADDITVMATAPKPKSVCHKMSQYLDCVADWFKQRGLILSPSKSTVTLFTTWTKQLGGKNIRVSMDGHILPYNPQPKILGVTFDELLKFHYHGNNIANTVGQRNRILKCLAGTSWGCSKELILLTYKAIGRAVYDYAASAWTPQVSDATWYGLQTKQNEALRVACGCHRMAKVEHLHHETEMLNVRQHCELLTKQSLLGAHLIARPDHIPLHHYHHTTVAFAPPFFKPMGKKSPHSSQFLLQRRPTAAECKLCIPQP